MSPRPRAGSPSDEMLIPESDNSSRRKRFITLISIHPTMIVALLVLGLILLLPLLAQLRGWLSGPPVP